MFTGIVRNRAAVIRQAVRGGMLRVAFRLLRPEPRPLRAGESVAVSGVCLTVVKAAGRIFEADIVSDTLKATTLGRLKKNARVNIERSLKAGEEIGGHFVTGHVDGLGRVLAVRRRGRNAEITVEVPAPLGRLLTRKGSVAVDGVSLTVQETGPGWFRAAVIPYTWKETTLAEKRPGSSVNLEADLIARYLEVFSEASPGPGPKLTLPFLKRRGF